MGSSVQEFKDYYEASIHVENPETAQQRVSEFFRKFVLSTKRETVLLESYLKSGNIVKSYELLAKFKYLIEYSDDLSRYWHLMRGYSGALAKLNTDKSVKGAKRLYAYYFEKYGDRRILKEEHWFERKRWEFLDELESIFTEYEIETFAKKYQRVLIENFEIYSSFLTAFILDLKRLQGSGIPEKK